MNSLPTLIFTLTLLFLLPFSTSKTITGKLNMVAFNHNHFQYVSKMSMDIGDGGVYFRGRFEQPIKHPNTPEHIYVYVYAYVDDDWDAVLSKRSCQEKTEMARAVFSFQLPTNGDWSDQLYTTLTQRLRTRVWYLAFGDCDRVLPQYTTTGNKIVYELQMMNSDGSHFSAEEAGIEWPLFIEMLVLIAFFGSNAVRFFRFFKTQETLDYAFLITNGAIFIELLSIFCEFWHLFIYSKDGIGSGFLDFFSQAFQVFSQFVITLLLILIASGWSIHFFEIDDMDLYIPLALILGLLHVLIVGIGRIADEEHSKFHDYETIPGWIVIFFRFVFFAIFIYFARSTIDKEEKGSNKEDRLVFMRRFLLLGSIYLLAFPVVVIISSAVVASYVRHKVVTIGSLTLQVTAAIILTYLFSAKRSKYNQVSMKGRTLLPSASGKIE